MPIICAFVPSFKLAAALHDRPLEPATPALLVDKLERGTILDACELARSLGVRLGMTLTQAVACARDAHVAVDDRPRAATLWSTFLDALDAASPLVEDAGEGTAYLEMRGIEGTPARWLDAVREALAHFPIPFRLGCAANKFTASVAARTHDNAVWPAGSERAHLAPLPLDLLALPAGMREKLLLLGVRTLGELADLPAGPLARRFGTAALRLHEHARGIDREPIVPRPRTLHIDRTLYGEGSAECEEQLLFALRTLVARVAEDVALAGRRCGRLVLSIECESGDVVPIACSFAQPTAQASMFFDLLRARLEGVVLQSPAIGLRLGAERLEEGGRPLSLFPSSDPDPQTLQLMIARLDAALGEGAARKIALEEGYRYEARSAATSFTPELPAQSSFMNESTNMRPAVMQCRLHAALPVDVQIIRGAPAFVGTPPQAVLDYAGPWRADERWWDAPFARDEYDVLLEDGTLCRLARSGKEWAITVLYD